MRDVIVIGAGGGGAVIAKELAAQGLDVLVLEAGPAAKPEADWTHFEIDQSAPGSGMLRFGPTDRTKPPWSRELPQNSFIWQVAGVGGTTQHYLGNSPRAYPGVFNGYSDADRNAYDRRHEFPFSYGELVPYYEWVEETLPVETAAMGKKEQAFLEAAAAMGGLAVQRSKDTTANSYRPQENAILQPRGIAGRTSDPRKLAFPAAFGCTFCGHCVQGCKEPLGSPRNLRAKRSTDNSYMPMALMADRWTNGRAVTLVGDAYATRILAEGRNAHAVSWRVGATGETQTEEARVVVLAAGAIESPRLWLNSGLPNPNDWVGRGLTDHSFDLVFGVLPRDIESSKGPGSAARADFPGRGALEGTVATPAAAAFSAALSDSGVARDGVGRLVGRNLKAALSDIDRLLSVFVLTDDDVESQNRVTLSAFPPDEHGPIARVEMRHRARSARTAANREYLAGKALELVTAAGATAAYRMNWPPVLAHIHSTLRSGGRPEDSVLDEYAEARAVPRLFVADNSALPNSVGGANPTLTTQALATRTAERIVRRYFDGDGWVASQQPISSISPSVTSAVAAIK
ncbi:MAG: GMC family oxidoreductase N-terminal domain-containing protein [Gaiellaceae bacterium]